MICLLLNLLVENWVLIRAFETSHGMAGGMVVYWRSGWPSIQLLALDSQTIHLQVMECILQSVVSCAYVCLYSALKDIFWDQLYQFSLSIMTPWIILGDFNDIAFSSEKVGGAALALIEQKNFLIGGMIVIYHIWEP